MDGEQEAKAIGFDPLHPRYLNLIRLRMAGALLVVAVLTAVADFLILPQTDLAWRSGPASATIAGLAILAAALLPRRRYRAWGRAIMDDELHIRHGVWTRVRTVVPFGRVQHIDVAHGPVERAFGLATLILHTAGTRGAAVPLPGLAQDDAERMRDLIRAEIRQDLL